MKKVILGVVALVSVSTISVAQSGSPDRPKLMVGIMVDQMRYEYLHRFYAKFGEGGFRRLMNDGFMLKNAHYNYMPTITGPGHASVYTGTTPSIHGIIGNDYYDKEKGKTVNCVEDQRHKPVGSANGNGDVSPWRMLSSTVTDELKLFTQKRSKVIGISIKDRGAVLPAGHMADAAYWYDAKNGRFISSTYYMTQLPEWAEKFNGKNLADIYLAQEWKTLLPIEQYTESGPDDSPYERRYTGKPKTTFPYKLSELRAQNGNFDLLSSTPFASDYLTEMTKAAITGEKLGKDDNTDFLCISYSATDAVGHQFGPNSVEVEDSYIRLDRNLADLFKFLDREIGAGIYTVFLTGDHGVADVPQYLTDNKMPGGYFNESRTKVLLDEFLNGYFPGKKLISSFSSDQVYLDHDAFQRDPKSSGIDMFIVAELIGKFMMTQEGVANYYTEGMIRQGRYDEKGAKGMIIRGHHAKRSGDVVFLLESGWLEAGSPQGTTHGSPYAYDTQVPVLFYGKGVRKGFTTQYHTITDIAPTISILLNIKIPSGCTGQPVSELFGQ
ncbi:MAG TPA: alkaline phosphatase PafA [Ohtaekwangia sp.]